MIVSGLRVFDIWDPLHPTEIGYFNGPVRPGTPGLKEGAFAMSSPAYDLAHHEIWYSDGNTGFYTVRLTSAAADIAGTGSTAAIPVPATTAPTQAAAPQSAPQSAPQAAPAVSAPGGTRDGGSPSRGRHSRPHDQDPRGTPGHRRIRPGRCAGPAGAAHPHVGLHRWRAAAHPRRSPRRRHRGWPRPAASREASAGGTLTR